jgi:hypothetical protein
MLRIHAIGLAVLALLVVGAIGALTASAVEHGKHTWDINGTPITSALKLHSLALVLLTDKKGGIFNEAVTVHCKGFDDGYVFPKGLDLVLHVSATLHGSLLGIELDIPCNRTAGICPSPVTARAVNLPWLTLLVLFGTEVRDLIERDPNGPGGNPGWLVNCGGTIDECTAELGSTGLKNVTGGVEAIFDAVTPKANCTRGGVGEGSVTGLDLNESPSATETLLFL